MLFKDHDTSRKILETEDALEAKQLAREIQPFDYRNWKEQARELCEPSILS